jgi:hypothetical protein
LFNCTGRFEESALINPQPSLIIVGDNNLLQFTVNDTIIDTVFVSNKDMTIEKVSPNSQMIILKQIQKEVSSQSLDTKYVIVSITGDSINSFSGRWPIWSLDNRRVYFSTGPDSAIHYCILDIENGKSDTIISIPFGFLPEYSANNDFFMTIAGKDSLYFAIVDIKCSSIKMFENQTKITYKNKSYHKWGISSFIIRCNEGAFVIKDTSGFSDINLGFGEWYQQRIINIDRMAIVSSSGGTKLSPFYAILGNLINRNRLSLINENGKLIQEFWIEPDIVPVSITPDNRFIASLIFSSEINIVGIQINTLDGRRVIRKKHDSIKEIFWI